MIWSNDRISQAKNLRDLGWTNERIGLAMGVSLTAVKGMFWREDNKPSIDPKTRKLNEPYNPLKAMIARLDKTG